MNERDVVHGAWRALYNYYDQLTSLSTAIIFLLLSLVHNYVRSRQLSLHREKLQRIETSLIEKLKV